MSRSIKLFAHLQRTVGLPFSFTRGGEVETCRLQSSSRCRSCRHQSSCSCHSSSRRRQLWHRADFVNSSAAFFAACVAVSAATLVTYPNGDIVPADTADVQMAKAARFDSIIYIIFAINAAVDCTACVPTPPPLLGVLPRLGLAPQQPGLAALKQQHWRRITNWQRIVGASVHKRTPPRYSVGYKIQENREKTWYNPLIVF